MIGILCEAILPRRGFDTQSQPAILYLHGKAKRWRREEPVRPARQGHAHQIDGRVGFWWKIIDFVPVGLGVEAPLEILSGPEKTRSPARLSGIIPSKVVRLRQLTFAFDFHFIRKTVRKALKAISFCLPEGTFRLKDNGSNTRLFVHLPLPDPGRIVAAQQGMDT